jgi:hypothetical protein
VDLEKCFDRVTHEQWMSRVTERVTDRRVLRRIDRYLKAGALTGDGVDATPEGGRCRPGERICGGTDWTRRGSVGGTGACATRRRGTSTCKAREPGRACWPV